MANTSNVYTGSKKNGRWWVSINGTPTFPYSTREEMRHALRRLKADNARLSQRVEEGGELANRLQQICDTFQVEVLLAVTKEMDRRLKDIKKS